MSTATVLLVGTEDGLCTRGKRALADPEAFELRTCTSAEEVVAAVQDTSPDVIVVDLDMPSLGGMEVLHQLRKKELIRFVPLAVVGGDEGIAWRAELFKGGVADIIDHKADDGELQRRIAALLEGRPWGAETLGEQPPGPAVEIIAALERDKKSGRFSLACGDKAGEILVEKGLVQKVEAGGLEGEEALNLLAGSPGWTATPRVEAGDPPPSRPSARVPEIGETKVLLVDDDRTVLRLFEIFLGRHGYKILTASSGEEGYEEAGRSLPDIIITDVMMPNGDGWWLLTKLRQDFLLRETVCLFFTNKGASPHKAEEVGIKPDKYLDKDPHLNNVTRALEEALAPLRKLHARLCDEASGTVQGKVDEAGVLPLLRILRQAGRTGRLVLTAAPGQTAVLGLRGDVLTSAKLSGKERADGLDALGRIVAGDFGSFRFEPNVHEGGGDELGPMDRLVREACERNQKFFEVVKVHALSAAGGVEKDSVLADRFRAAASPKVGPVARAVLRGENAEAIARSTGMELSLVEHVLFEMFRHGAFKMPGTAKPAALPIPGRESARVPSVSAAPPAARPAPIKSPLLDRPKLPLGSTPAFGTKLPPLGSTPARGTKLPPGGTPAFGTGLPRPGPSGKGSAPTAVAPPGSGSGPVKVGPDKDADSVDPWAPGAARPVAGKTGDTDEDAKTDVRDLNRVVLPPPASRAAGDSVLPPLGAGGAPDAKTSSPLPPSKQLDPPTMEPDEDFEDMRPRDAAKRAAPPGPAPKRPPEPPAGLRSLAPPLPSPAGAAPAGSGQDLPPLPSPPVLPRDEAIGAPGASSSETPQPVAMVAAPLATSGRKRLTMIGAGAAAIALVAVIIRLAGGGDDPDPSTAAASASAAHTSAEYVPTSAAPETNAPETAATEAAAASAAPETASPETAAPKTPEPRTAVAAVRTAAPKDPEPRTAKEPKEPREPRTAKEPKEPRTAAAGKTDPAAARAHFDAGNKLFLKGNKGGAITAFKKAIKADRGYADPHRGLALTYASMGKKAEAQRELDAYLRLKPGAKDAGYVKKKIDEL